MPWPAESKSWVRSTAVFGSYHCFDDAKSSISMAQALASSPV